MEWTEHFWYPDIVRGSHESGSARVHDSRANIDFAANCSAMSSRQTAIVSRRYTYVCSGCARGAISHLPAPLTCSPNPELGQAASAHHLQSDARAWAGPSLEPANRALPT
ncbi:hypothetical protein PMIN03_008773 [Paraphaeosphaeria minitans]